MNVVVLSVCDAVDIHLVRRLRAAHPAIQVVRIVSGPTRSPAGASLWSKVSLKKLVNRTDRVFRGWYGTRMRREISRLLFGVPEPPAPDVDHEVIGSEVNDEKTVAQLRQLAPDVLLVSGAPILKPSVISVPKLAAINVHYGFAPDYRGENTLFWPLYLGDHDRIGVTLHHIDPRIDAGRILAKGCPSLAPDDTEATLFAKCARLAADLAVDLVEAAKHEPLLGKPQESKGRVFLRRERRFWQDIRYELERRLRLRTLPVTKTRVVRHFEGA